MNAELPSFPFPFGKWDNWEFSLPGIQCMTVYQFLSTSIVPSPPRLLHSLFIFIASELPHGVISMHETLVYVKFRSETQFVDCFVSMHTPILTCFFFCISIHHISTLIIICIQSFVSVTQHKKQRNQQVMLKTKTKRNQPISTSEAH